jgi:hypothetical protein
MQALPIAGKREGISAVVPWILPVWHMTDTPGEACIEIVDKFLDMAER